MQEGQHNPQQNHPFFGLQGHSGFGGQQLHQHYQRSLSFQQQQEVEHPRITGRSERFGSHHEYLQPSVVLPHPNHNQLAGQMLMPSSHFKPQRSDYPNHQNYGIPHQNHQFYTGFPLHQTSSFAFQGIHVNKIQQSPKQYLTVTIVPLEQQIEPYHMMVESNPLEDKNLKTIFYNQAYWEPVFANHSPIIPPQFRVFKTIVSDYAHIFPHFQGLKLQILSLKCEGYQFPKNPNALPIEQFCKQHFFGPLVVALQTETAPPDLKSFYCDFLQNLRQINESEGRNYPPPPIPQILNNPSFLPQIGNYLNMQTFNLVSMCRNLSKACSESMNESFQKRLEIYLKAIDPEIFYIYRYKTSICANKSKDHDWNLCVYAHKPFDFRRSPDKFLYSPEKCKDYDQDTGLGCRQDCPLAHTTFEKLYHPNQYKTSPCQQFVKKRKNCQKGELCAFVHKETELRHIPTCDRLQLFNRLKKPANLTDPQIMQIELDPLPEMNEEELRQLQRITDQQIVRENLSSSSSSLSTNNSKLASSAQGKEGSLDYGSLSIQSQAFTPSYKKSSSCSESCDANSLLEINNSPQKMIAELDIDSLSQIEVQYQQPKSPMRHGSSSQTNLHSAESLLVLEKNLSCKQNDEQIMSAKPLIKQKDTRTMSRFQHIFDKDKNNDDHNYESHSESECEDDQYGGEIFSMDIGILSERLNK